MKQLILGGVRSGKSQYAEKLARTSGKPVTYIATAQYNDPEMQRRIATHQLRRPPNWELLEEPIALSNALSQSARENHCVLVDCLSLWLNNLYHYQDKLPDDIEVDTETLIAQLCIDLVNLVADLPGQILLVSSEVGLGVVPVNDLAREYSDRLGELNQALASICDRVIFCVAGIPQVLKGAPTK